MSKKSNKPKNHSKIVADEKSLRSSDLKENAGMTYRQINDWQEKGLLPDERKSNKKWRKFTPKEFFVILICKEIRDKFGVSLESLNYIRRIMLKEEANHFRYALQMCSFGFAVVLITDLKENFILDSDLEIEYLNSYGFFRSDEIDSYLSIKINPLINKMLKIKNLPELKIKNELYESVIKSTINAKISDQEREVIDLIRNESFKKVTVHLRDGNMLQIDTEEELLDESNRMDSHDLMDIIDSNEFQSITIQKQNDQIVRINRKIPRKVNNK